MSDILNNMKKRILSFINKNDDSLFVKKLKILTGEMEDIKTAFYDIEKMKDLKEAFGQNLDNYGSNVGEFPSGNEDNLYRLLIRYKIAENTSDGSIDHIANALSLAIDRPLNDIYVREGWSFVDENQPAAVYVSFPSEVFGDYNITYDRFIELFNNVVAGGVSTDFFLMKQGDIDIAATVPYINFSRLPFCNDFNTGQWTEQSEGLIYKRKIYKYFFTKEQFLPFAGTFNAGRTKHRIYYIGIGFSTEKIIYHKEFNYCDTFYCGEVAA